MRPIALASLLVVASTSSGAQRIDSALVARQLDSVYSRMTLAYQRSDARMAAALYDARAFYLPPGTPILRGRDAINREFTKILGSQPSTVSTGQGITFEIVNRAIAADIAFDIGLFRLGGSAPAGKFTVLWRKGTDGAWRIWADQYNDHRAAESSSEARQSPAAAAAGASALADLVGEYRAVYPGAFENNTIQVRLDAGRLTLHGMASTPAELQPSGADAFRVIDPAGPEGMVMRFHRSNGRVVSASLGTNSASTPGPAFFFLR